MCVNGSVHRPPLSWDRFTWTASIDELSGLILSSGEHLRCPYAVICFMYSVLLTHGIATVRQSMLTDETTSLIDPVFGHGSQLLINLLITGQSTSHLFDGVRSVAGLCECCCFYRFYLGWSFVAMSICLWIRVHRCCVPTSAPPFSLRFQFLYRFRLIPCSDNHHSLKW